MVDTNVIFGDSMPITSKT
jgi:hypothetical protein